jgi:hypothetical protein
MAVEYTLQRRKERGKQLGAHGGQQVEQRNGLHQSLHQCDRVQAKIGRYIGAGTST